jgi:hypothetical protein
MKRLRKIAEIEPRTAPPVYRRRPGQSPQLVRWLTETELSAAQQRIAERYRDHLVARLHPRWAMVELYIDPAAVSDADWTMIGILFEK